MERRGCKSKLSSALSGITFAVLIGAGLTSAVHAQSATANQGVVTGGQRVPLQLQAEPPELTAQQQLLREQAMDKSNLRGPDLPKGTAAPIHAPSQPSSTPAYAPSAAPTVGKSSSQSTVRPGPHGSTAAPSTMNYFRSSAQAPYSTGTSTISETHVGASGSVVFMTGNWFASYSTDGGSSFSFVNPYTQFSSIDGGFCCDQTVIYDRNHDLMIWQLQYTYSTTTQKGSYRTAFASAASVASSGWCTYDWNPGSFGLAAGLWLEIGRAHV